MWLACPCACAVAADTGPVAACDMWVGMDAGIGTSTAGCWGCDGVGKLLLGAGSAEIADIGLLSTSLMLTPKSVGTDTWRMGVASSAEGACTLSCLRFAADSVVRGFGSIDGAADGAEGGLGGRAAAWPWPDFILRSNCFIKCSSMFELIGASSASE